MSEEAHKDHLASLPSAEVSEIMGQVPPGVLRYGILVVSLVLMVLLTFAWLIRYPDVVEGPAVITSLNPPVVLISKSDGQILRLDVSDSTKVDSGQVLLIAGEPLDLSDLAEWESFLKSMFLAIRNDSVWLLPFFAEKPDMKLSVLQGEAAKVTHRWKAYLALLEREAYHYQPKAEALHRRIVEQDRLILSLQRQLRLIREKERLMDKEYARDSLLAAAGGISASELEQAATRRLVQRMEMEACLARLAEVEIRKGEYHQQLTDFLVENQEDLRLALRELEKALGEALSAYANWESGHIYRSPKKGWVSLGRFWKEGQEVGAGEVLLHILPEEPGPIIARLTLPPEGSGRIAPGASVHIRLDDFPYLEYGILEGELMRLSAIPEDGFLQAEVRLRQGLTTTYGISLDFRGSLSGRGTVITRDARLLERFIRPLRYLMKHNRRLENG
jgi:HlyD family secretion protein